MKVGDNLENSELVELVSNVDGKSLEQYIDKSISDYKISSDEHSIQFDYTWVDKVEESIDYLDAIIRSPKRFLAQEEEVVPVEKAKKISMETIKHLSQHTNLIQEVTEDGKVTPSSVLNVYKEETFDIYENRFINSLLSNLYTFMQRRKKETAEGGFAKCERKLEFNSETTVNTDKINIKLLMDTKSYEESRGSNSQGLTYEQRIEKVEFIIMDYMKTPLIQSLRGAIPVRSPIRKTNTILKNPNFNKALELWEYIERYDHKDRKERKENFIIDSDKEVQKKLVLASYMNYNIISAISSANDKSKDKSKDYYIRKLIEDFINENKEINANDFKQILNKSFALYKQKKQQRLNKIYKEFNRCMKKYNDNIKLGIQLLKK